MQVGRLISGIIRVLQGTALCSACFFSAGVNQASFDFGEGKKGESHKKEYKNCLDKSRLVEAEID